MNKIEFFTDGICLIPTYSNFALNILPNMLYHSTVLVGPHDFKPKVKKFLISEHSTLVIFNST